jgi:hypothetical protein
VGEFVSHQLRFPGRSTLCAILILTTILSISLVPQAKAVTSTVSVAQNTLTINLRLEVKENITQSLGVGLPTISLNSMNQNDLVRASQNITQAIQQKIGPSVTATVMMMSARSALLDNSTGMWLLQENYTIVVSGAVKTNGTLSSIDLSLLSMNVSSPMTIGGSELNKVGSAYLLKPIDLLRKGGTSYFVDGAEYTNTVVPDQVTSSFSFLDFSWVPPISRWDRQDNLLKQSTTFALAPTTPLLRGGLFNLTVGTFPVENVFLKKWIAVLDPSFQIVVPANAWSQGTTIYFDQPGVAELAMPIIAGVSLVAVALALVFDRRLTKDRGAFRRRKRS